MLSTPLLVLVMASCLAGQVACRPRDTVASDDNDVELTAGTVAFPSHQYGSFVGEVQVSSDHLSVSRANRLKNASSGPRVSALVAGPPEGSEVSVGSSPGLSVSGATLFFNNPAQVVPITP
ncbi:uncharacterized protein [Procambarus clarkii]|uniref:uncharacterized protein n=1 Tax=Procambarus clarkii TaxID=6728 RepID=UPI001E674433|nr:uncharacterized protein LOC123760627 [Procambarus clarkii]